MEFQIFLCRKLRDSFFHLIFFAFADPCKTFCFAPLPICMRILGLIGRKKKFLFSNGNFLPKLRQINKQLEHERNIFFEKCLSLLHSRKNVIV